MKKSFAKIICLILVFSLVFSSSPLIYTTYGKCDPDDTKCKLKKKAKKSCREADDVERCKGEKREAQRKIGEERARRQAGMAPAAQGGITDPQQAGDLAWASCKEGGGSDANCRAQAERAYLEVEKEHPVDPLTKEQHVVRDTLRRTALEKAGGSEGLSYEQAERIRQESDRAVAPELKEKHKDDFYGALTGHVGRVLTPEEINAYSQTEEYNQFVSDYFNQHRDQFELAIGKEADLAALGEELLNRDSVSEYIQEQKPPEVADKPPREEDRKQFERQLSQEIITLSPCQSGSPTVKIADSGDLDGWYRCRDGKKISAQDASRLNKSYELGVMKEVNFEQQRILENQDFNLERGVTPAQIEALNELDLALGAAGKLGIPADLTPGLQERIARDGDLLMKGIISEQEYNRRVNQIVTEHYQAQVAEERGITLTEEAVIDDFGEAYDLAFRLHSERFTPQVDQLPSKLTQEMAAYIASQMVVQSLEDSDGDGIPSIYERFASQNGYEVDPNRSDQYIQKQIGGIRGGMTTVSNPIQNQLQDAAHRAGIYSAETGWKEPGMLTTEDIKEFQRQLHYVNNPFRILDIGIPGPIPVLGAGIPMASFTRARWEGEDFKEKWGNVALFDRPDAATLLRMTQTEGEWNAIIEAAKRNGVELPEVDRDLFGQYLRATNLGVRPRTSGTEGGITGIGPMDLVRPGHEAMTGVNREQLAQMEEFNDKMVDYLRQALLSEERWDYQHAANTFGAELMIYGITDVLLGEALPAMAKGVKKFLGEVRWFAGGGSFLDKSYLEVAEAAARAVDEASEVLPEPRVQPIEALSPWVRPEVEMVAVPYDSTAGRVAADMAGRGKPNAVQRVLRDVQDAFPQLPRGLPQGVTQRMSGFVDTVRNSVQRIIPERYAGEIAEEVIEELPEKELPISGVIWELSPDNTPIAREQFSGTIQEIEQKLVEKGTLPESKIMVNEEAFLFDGESLQPMQTFYHYTSGEGAEGIVDDGVIKATSRAPFLRRGSRVYLTDISPENIRTSGENPVSVFFHHVKMLFRLEPNTVGLPESKATHYFKIYAPSEGIDAARVSTLSKGIGISESYLPHDLPLDSSNYIITGPFLRFTEEVPQEIAPSFPQRVARRMGDLIDNLIGREGGIAYRGITEPRPPAETLNIVPFDDVPRIKINPDDLAEEIISRSPSGKGSGGDVYKLGLEIGDEQRVVAVKVYHSPDPRRGTTAESLLAYFKHEVRGAQVFDQTGIGPRFYGVADLGDNRLAYVMDFVEGDFPEVMKSSVTSQTLEDIKRVPEILHQHGFDLVGDFQYYVTPKGRAVVIDPGPVRTIDELFEAYGRNYGGVAEQLLEKDEPKLIKYMAESAQPKSLLGRITGQPSEIVYRPRLPEAVENLGLTIGDQIKVPKRVQPVVEKIPGINRLLGTEATLMREMDNLQSHAGFGEAVEKLISEGENPRQAYLATLDEFSNGRSTNLFSRLSPEEAQRVAGEAIDEKPYLAFRSGYYQENKKNAELIRGELDSLIEEIRVFIEKEGLGEDLIIKADQEAEALFQRLVENEGKVNRYTSNFDKTMMFHLGRSRFRFDPLDPEISKVNLKRLILGDYLVRPEFEKDMPLFLKETNLGIEVVNQFCQDIGAGSPLRQLTMDDILLRPTFLEPKFAADYVPQLDALTIGMDYVNHYPDQAKATFFHESAHFAQEKGEQLLTENIVDKRLRDVLTEGGAVWIETQGMVKSGIDPDYLEYLKGIESAQKYYSIFSDELQTVLIDSFMLGLPQEEAWRLMNLAATGDYLPLVKTLGRGNEETGWKVLEAILSEEPMTQVETLLSSDLSPAQRTVWEIRRNVGYYQRVIQRTISDFFDNLIGPEKVPGSFLLTSPVFAADSEKEIPVSSLLYKKIAIVEELAPMIEADPDLTLEEVLVVMNKYETIDSQIEREGETVKISTGEAGYAQYSVPTGFYQMKVDSLEGFDVSLPAEGVNLRNTENVVIEVGIQEGEGKVITSAKYRSGEESGFGQLLQGLRSFLPFLLKEAHARPVEAPEGVVLGQKGFGELLEEVQTGEPVESQSSGTVTLMLYHDANGNGEREAGENSLPWAGVKITLEKTTEEVSYKLLEGWNFVSFPVVPQSFSTAAELVTDAARQGADITTVARWDGSKWVEYIQRGDQAYGQDFPLEPGVAYMLRNHVHLQEWRVAGFKIGSSIPLELKTGFNSVGIPYSEVEHTASTVLDGINLVVGKGLTPETENADLISRFVSGNWDVFIKRIYSEDNIQEYGNDFRILPSEGYFIKVKKEVNWTP